MTLGASTWSPGFSAWNTAVAAAMPLANSSAWWPPSSALITASAWSKAGLSARAYTRPLRYWLSSSRR